MIGQNLLSASTVLCALLVVSPALGQGVVEDYTKVDTEKLGIKPVSPKTDRKTGFIVGGKNATTNAKTDGDRRSVDRRPGRDDGGRRPVHGRLPGQG